MTAALKIGQIILLNDCRGKIQLKIQSDRLTHTQGEYLMRVTTVTYNEKMIICKMFSAVTFGDRGSYSN